MTTPPEDTTTAPLVLADSLDLTAAAPLTAELLAARGKLRPPSTPPACSGWARSACRCCSRPAPSGRATDCPGGWSTLPRSSSTPRP